MELNWNDLYISAINKNKTIKTKYIDIIKSSSGTVKAGEILALMGPSGAGKSTLLNALAGRIPANAITQGSILFNGKERKLGEWIDSIGYVEQTPYLMNELTLEENLKYSYRLNKNKINVRTKKNEIIDQNKNIIKITEKETLNEIIQILNLENVRKNSTEKLSGGEKKRLSIGMALVQNPSILFLDEPTSGLDMDNAVQICKNIRKLAIEKNMIIILTIHQPNEYIFSFFNKLLLLSNGNVLYYGLTNHVEQFFVDRGLTKNPLYTTPDFIIEICGDNYKKENAKLFYNENSLFKDNIVIKNKNKIKKKNDTIFNIKFSFYHCYLLLVRELTLISRKKLNFIKFVFFRILWSIAFIFIAKHMGPTIDLIDHIIDTIEELDLIHVKIVNDQLMDKLIRFGQIMVGILSNKSPEKILRNKNTAMMGAYSFMISYEIITSVSTYFDNMSTRRIEILNWFYSCSSLSIALISIQILNEMFIGIFSSLLFYVIVKPSTFYFIALFFISPFIIQPFSFLLASLSPTRLLGTMIGYVFGNISMVPAKIISYYLIKKRVEPGTFFKITKYFSYVFFLISPFIYSTSAFYFIQKQLKIYKDEDLQKHLKFIYNHTLNIKLLYCLIPTLTLIFLCLGILVTGLRISMNVRMKTERKTV